MSFAFVRDRLEKGKNWARMSPLSLAHPHDCSLNFVITRCVPVANFSNATNYTQYEFKGCNRTNFFSSFLFIK